MKNRCGLPDTLTPYGIVVRYPNELNLQAHHVKEALRYASEIVEWVAKIVNSQPGKSKE